MVPAKGAERAYALLREAIRQTERVGIATIVMREAQHLAAVEVIKDALVLTLMRYANELVDSSAYTFPPAKDIRKAELDMAVTLVKNLADEWDPSQYTDEYRENLMKIIKAKLKGKDVKLTAHVEPREAGVVDLMERLRQSLEGANRSTKAKKPAKAARAKKTAGATKRRRAA
jgi:DNA end-binding protein Ku